MLASLSLLVVTTEDGVLFISYHFDVPAEYISIKEVLLSAVTNVASPSNSN